MTKRKEHQFFEGIEKKHCYECEEWKILDDFNNLTSAWDGKQIKCRICERKVRRKHKTSGITKECGVCHQIKPELEFDQSRFTEDKLKRVCKQCDTMDHGPDHKRCSICFQILLLERFAPKNGRGCGYHSSCYPCAYIAKGNRYDEYNKKYQATYRVINYEKLAKQHAKYFQNNKETIYKSRIEYLKNNPVARIAVNLRSRVYYAIKAYQHMDEKAKKNSPTIDLCGCSFATVAAWLEFQFTVDMSWENYGKTWHIDHVIPCNAFDLTKEDHQKICFHWSNLKPLKCAENIAKSDGIFYDYIFKQELAYAAKVMGQIIIMKRADPKKINTKFRLHGKNKIKEAIKLLKIKF
jgi:hypothetical protein